jgi:hypothetical protein
MKINCIFDASGNLINIGPWDYQFSVNENEEQIIGNPLPSGAYSEDREVFTDEDGGRYIAKNPFVEGENWVSKHFSVARLLQMKVWWDSLPHEKTPKLSSVYDWTNGITLAAASGSTTFPLPPHSFEELVAECVALQQ